MLGCFNFRHILIVILSLVLTFLVSCADRTTASILDDIETYIKVRPDSALAVISDIDTTTLNSRSLRAHYSLLHTIALDKNWIDTTDVSVVMPALTYYDRHPYDVRRAKAWYYYGRIQENCGDYALANISFLKAEKYAGEKAEENFKALIYISLSGTYSASYLNKDALRYSELAFQTYSKLGDTLGLNASRFRMAQDLTNLMRYSEADSLYRLLLDDKNVLSLSYLYSTIVSDYALLQLLQYDDYESAVRLFEESLRSSGELRMRNHWGAYAYSLLRVGKKEQANAIFKQLEVTDDDESLTYKTWRGRADAYLGNFATAYDYILLATEVQAENVARILRQSALHAQRDYFKEEQVEMQLRVQKQRVLLVVSIFLFFVLLVGGLFFYKRKKRRMVEEYYSLLESLHSLSSDYNQANDDRTQIRSQYIKICQTHFKQLGRINELLHNFTKEKDTSLYQEIKKAVQGIQNDEKSQQEFEKVLNDSLNNVMIHYRETFPNKKDRDYQLASFLFAGFNAATISSILYDYSKDNIYLIKHRLKKEISETESPYQEQFLSLLS